MPESGQPTLTTNGDEYTVIPMQHVMKLHRDSI